MADNIFDIEIITPDRVFYKGETDFLEFNTQNGEIGVYKNHIPLTTVLAPGIVTIHNGDEEKIAAIHSGFAEIKGCCTTKHTHNAIDNTCDQNMHDG